MLFAERGRFAKSVITLLPLPVVTSLYFTNGFSSFTVYVLFLC